MRDNQRVQILIVDDDEIELIKRENWIQESKDLTCDIVTATTDEQAREAIINHDFDLLILDVRLRDNASDLDDTGFQLALEQARTGTPVIVLTEFPSYSFVRKANNLLDAGKQRLIQFIGKEEGKAAYLDVVKGSLRGRNVFIVHGRDPHNKRFEVQAFLQQLGLDPIILEQQPNAGRHIFGKFKDYSDVAYVVVIMTPDDVGGLAEEGAAMSPRVRQNVVFEMGYFVGKNGWEKIALLNAQHLVKDNPLEMFSDAYGITYIPMQDSSWREKLVKELKYVGIQVNNYP